MVFLEWDISGSLTRQANDAQPAYQGLLLSGELAPAAGDLVFSLSVCFGSCVSLPELADLSAPTSSSQEAPRTCSAPFPAKQSGFRRLLAASLRGAARAARVVRRASTFLATRAEKRLSIASGSSRRNRVVVEFLRANDSDDLCTSVLQRLDRIRLPATYVLSWVSRHPERRRAHVQLLEEHLRCVMRDRFVRVYTAGGQETARLFVALVTTAPLLGPAQSFCDAMEVWSRVWSRCDSPERRMLSVPIRSPSGYFWVDLGCGPYCRRGFVGIDGNYYEGVSILWDLNRGIPFPENSVSHVHCSHFLEHVDDPMFQLREIHRVGVAGGTVDLIVPLHEPASPVRYSRYDDHQTMFTEEWLDSCLRRDMRRQFSVLSSDVQRKQGRNQAGVHHSWTQIELQLRIEK